jgi:hypothetical protein
MTTITFTAVTVTNMDTGKTDLFQTLNLAMAAMAPGYNYHVSEPTEHTIDIGEELPGDITGEDLLPSPHSHDWQQGSDKMQCIDCGEKKQWLAGNWQTVQN